MVTMLDAVSSSSGYSASCSLANSSTNVDGLVVEDVVGLHEHAELAGRADVSAWSRSRSSITCESWLTHSIGVGLEDELVLHDDAADEDQRGCRR